MIRQIRDSPAFSTVALIVAAFLLTTAGILIVRYPIGPLFGGTTSATDAGALLPGITVDNAPPPAIGLVVTSLRSGGEAEHAGLQVGDAVIAVDGRAIKSLGQISPYLRRDRSPRIDLAIAHGDRLRHVVLTRSQDGSHGA